MKHVHHLMRAHRARPDLSPPAARVMRNALRFLEPHRNLPLDQFGPLRLRGVQTCMIESGLSRQTCMDYAARIRSAFRWAVAEEWIEPKIAEALRYTRPPKTNGHARTDLHVPTDAEISQALTHLPMRAIVAVKVQFLTAMRPGELLLMRPCDLRTRPESDLLEYRPRHHKTAHLGRDRVVLLGPQAQTDLRPALDTTLDEWPVFRAAKTNGRPHQWSVRRYHAMLTRACDGADVPRFNPRSLRHAGLRRLEKLASARAAQQAAGHASPSTTRIYLGDSAVDAARALSRFG